MQTKSRHDTAFLTTALLFIAALLLRACAAGFTYYPILDDSIQYILYPSSQSYWQLILEEGLFASRPLAIIADLFFVGPFSDCLIVPALLLSAMHGISGAIFTRLFRKYFKTGWAFTVLYALLPLGIEGTYWISASARIVPGLLFVAVAANLLDAFMERGGIWRAVLYALAALCAMGFYEQILVLTVTLSGLQFLTFVRQNRRASAALLCLPMAGIYFAFTSYFASSGAIGARMTTVFPTTLRYYFDTFLPDVARQIGAAFGKGGVRTLFLGFWRGLTGSASVGGVIYLILTIAVSVALFFLLRPMEKGKETRRVVPLGSPRGTIVWGILLTIAPLTPYLVIDNPYFSLRATVTSFVGLGLLFDLVLRALCRDGRAYAGVTAALAAICLIAGASEVRDYRAAGEADDRIVDAIYQAAPEMSGRIGILGMEEFATAEQNYAYHEHVASVGSSSWALSSKVIANLGMGVGEELVPLSTSGFSFYHGWNTAEKRIDGFDQIWAWDKDSFTLTPLTMEQIGEHDFHLRTPDGAIYATVWEEDDYGYIKFGE